MVGAAMDAEDAAHCRLPPHKRPLRASPRPRKLPGHLVVDAEPIGMGGFGTVYKGYDLERQMRIALKRSRPGSVAGARMKREIEVQRKFAHDHIMPILEFDPRWRWFTMPLATRSLAELGANERVPPPLLATILKGVAQGLQYAHYRNHIHRDVTPTNILALADPSCGHRWVVSDWGLVGGPLAFAQDALPITLTGQALGTRAFGPPEMRREPHGVGPEADVYYIGAVASWALTGVEPSPGQVAPVPQIGWDSLVRRTTAPDPAARFSSMVDVIAALNSLARKYGPSGGGGRQLEGSDCPECAGRVDGSGRCTYCKQMLNPAFN